MMRINVMSKTREESSTQFNRFISDIGYPKTQTSIKVVIYKYCI